MTTENLEKAELSYFCQKLRLEDNLLKKPFLNYNHHYTVYTLILCYLLHTTSVQSLSCVQLFTTPWTAAGQASLSITNSLSLLKFMSIESVMPSNHLIFCHPLLLLPSIFPSIKVFSNEWVSSSHQVAKVLQFHLQHQTFQWIFRTDFL